MTTGVLNKKSSSQSIQAFTKDERCKLQEGLYGCPRDCMMPKEQFSRKEKTFMSIIRGYVFFLW